MASNYVNNKIMQQKGKAMDKQIKTRLILSLLKNYYIGSDNFIPKSELQKIFDLEARNVQRIIRTLRMCGHPICFNENGYFYAETQKEINDTLIRLRKMVNGISKLEVGLLSVNLNELRRNKIGN